MHDTLEDRNYSNYIPESHRRMLYYMDYLVGKFFILFFQLFCCLRLFQIRRENFFFKLKILNNFKMSPVYLINPLLKYLRILIFLHNKQY